MPDPTSSTKVFLFRLNNWTIEKENALLDKFEAYGLNDYWQGYNPPGHPTAVRGLYFVPDIQELKTQVERLVSESITLNMSILGTYDLFDNPFSNIEKNKDPVPPPDIEKNKDPVPIAYIILAILILLLILGVLK
ncbi:MULTISPECIES: hypothetical protein [Leptospira]|uniref:Uncharacterized protein n=1 Tax=Leptospira weilii str. 2006001855 TaxID=996804 RepID=M6FKA9_9LEPT|nr:MULTISPECIES: hypothetical protein [Leptospira]EMJ66464.1 hypothetical protein LEP1GSC051_0121 [Leptospira sp. P2653]EMM71587.1 hypothetical protein LEP1GSC038_0359 [Leptospira weilii str. 2006001855]MCL8265552.1 hypothetical protein [Leptospira weilii]